jgi:glycosyltransferase involved in cell wall biosynthesis
MGKMPLRDPAIADTRPGVQSFPRLSVVIATKDRPATLARLLQAVKKQSLRDVEVIVVDDGSSAETVQAYGSLWPTLDDRFRLELRPPGGGPGGSRNVGIRLAQGEFVAFCDDDDIWVREDHLKTAVAALSRYDADLYFANMQTSADGVVYNPDWYGVGERILKRRPLDPERTLFEVRQIDLARFLRRRILHADTLVVRKELLLRMGLYWDKIHFAEDHELALRLADSARKTLFCSNVAADVDVSNHPSIARRHDPEDRLFFDILAIMHAEYRIRSPRLRRVARRNRAGRMTALSTMLLDAGRGREALDFALQSVAISPHPGTLRHLCKVLLRIFPARRL